MLPESEVAALVPRRKASLLLTVVSNVLQLYSAHFRKTYLQDEACDTVAGIATRGAVSPNQCARLARRIDQLVQAAMDEGYSLHEPRMAFESLMEFVHPNGVFACNVVGTSSIAYARQMLYRQGLTDEEGRTPEAYFESLQIPVYRLAHAAYTIVRSSPDEQVEAHLSALSLPLEGPPVSSAVRKRMTLRPPRHERWTEDGSASRGGSV
jgi:hypothetical protein